MKLKFYFIPLSILCMLTGISLSCNTVRKQDSTNPYNLIGVWELYKQTGTLQDVCQSENLQFTSDGKAILQCPGATSITRTYTAKNGILTYTETGIMFKFKIYFDESSTRLEMYGQNVGRNLFYKKISDKQLKENKQKSGSNSNGTLNSSESQ